MIIDVEFNYFYSFRYLGDSPQVSYDVIKVCICVISDMYIKWHL